MTIFSEYLKAVVEGKYLSADDAEAAFGQIISGDVSDVCLAAFLGALATRGETAQELLGITRAVRSYMLALESVPEGTLDVCGTGGDGLGTLNVSTAVAFVLAGLGVPVAKHGGRALSSQAGATDVLEVLGIPADGDILRQEQRLQKDGLAFLAAPLHHPVMKQAAAVRRALGFRTVFNLVGPLCNPARVKRQLVGVFDRKWLRPVAEVLRLLGGTHMCVVHGETDEGGIDELTLAGPSHLVFCEGKEMIPAEITPDMTGLPLAVVRSLRGGDARYNAMRLEALLQGEEGCYRDTVVLNAAVALHVAGRGSVLVEGRVCSRLLQKNVALAMHSLKSGLAFQALCRARREHPTGTESVSLFSS